ncbi:bifunctional 2-polyprenyl-6-hydroxyphenol methylase/3-demethylubiquinol 3-O-methyltransferase UbiG [Arachnia propionica]|uniref:Class I SAM-dependent methyltransferase n=1 Tax=Arachnia propionica TaxID=1750 RepID=A0A3P1WR91_9ACTN|nr:class I SAM-dependent methyltransferase [Arachnia propionica]RRD48815.1 class I SAM-dependent methyltransferase [Arachnia propionica]
MPTRHHQKLPTEGPVTDVQRADLTRPTALARPEDLIDWRLAVTWEAATSCGMIDALPGTPDEVAETAGLDAGAVAAVAHLLAEWGLLTVGHDSRITCGPAMPSPAEATALAQHGVWVRRWSCLVGERLRDRTAPPPESLRRIDPIARLKHLAAASQSFIPRVIDACLAQAPGAKRVLDLGGGHGEYSIELAHRGLAVTMQDLPDVVAAARQDPRLAGVRLVGASLVDEVAEGPFDLVLLSTVTNMFDAQTNRDLMHRIRPVLAPGGRVAIVSYMRDRGVVGAVFGVQMLVSTDAGDAHAASDHLAWLADAGFEDCSVTDLTDPPLTLVVGRRR